MSNWLWKQRDSPILLFIFASSSVHPPLLEGRVWVAKWLREEALQSWETWFQIQLCHWLANLGPLFNFSDLQLPHQKNGWKYNCPKLRFSKLNEVAYTKYLENA